MSEPKKPSGLERLLEIVKTNVPILGGLAGDGARTSGAAFGTGAVGIVLSLDIPATWKAGCVTFLAAVWIVSGAIKRPEAAAPVAAPEGDAGRAG